MPLVRELEAVHAESVASAAQAQKILGWLRPLMAEREEKLITEAVKGVRSGDLADRDAVRLWVAISEQRKIREELEKIIRKAEKSVRAKTDGELAS